MDSSRPGLRRGGLVDIAEQADIDDGFSALTLGWWNLPGWSAITSHGEPLFPQYPRPLNNILAIA